MIRKGRIAKLIQTVLLLTLAVFYPVVSHAKNTILFENFEGSSLDSRIKIESVGNADWGVRPTTLFGSNYAFGFGSSDCGSGCTNSYITKLIITFPKPVYATSLSFKEIEILRPDGIKNNIGSGGVVRINGAPIVVYEGAFYKTFGRLPYNDGADDTAYRSHAFAINKTVYSIELWSWDIAFHSEILLDDLQITGYEPANVQTYNVAADWSYTQNPNGVWSYNEGSTPLPYALFPWINIPEICWANGGYPPAWTKMQTSPPYGWAPDGDIAWGDVIVHSVSVNPNNPAPANLTWTSPGTGTIDISGTIWDAYHYIERDDSWGLKLNGTILAGRAGIQGIKRNVPEASLASNISAGQSLNALKVQKGDVLELYVQPTTAIGHFVGVDLAVKFIPGAAYSYTGNKFNLFTCEGDSLCATPNAGYTSYTTDDFVTATLTLDEALPGNKELMDITNLSGFRLEIYDGHQLLTYPDEVLVSTDSNGNIVAPWSIISNGSVPPNNGSSTVNWPDNRGISDGGALSAPTGSYPLIPRDQGMIFNSPGVWTILQEVNTPVGGDVEVQPSDPATGEAPATLTFSEVTEAGNTELSVSRNGAPPPTGFKLGAPPTYYEISTTAVFTGPVGICIDYSEISFDNSSKLRLFHFESGKWTDVSVSLDTVNKVICGSVNSLSPFAIFESDYTATIRPPINADGSSVFDANRGVVPIKFSLALGGTATCDLPPATIAMTRSQGTDSDAISELDYSLPAGVGPTFRVDSCQYIYNLNTKSMGAGTYSVQIKINEVVVGSATFTLK
jgi:hypothetical protein